MRNFVCTEISFLGNWEKSVDQLGIFQIALMEENGDILWD